MDPKDTQTQNLNISLNLKALVGTSDHEKALKKAFSVIVKLQTLLRFVPSSSNCTLMLQRSDLHSGRHYTQHHH